MSLIVMDQRRGPVGASQPWQGRVVALGGNGAVIPLGGIAIIQSDVSSITCNVYDVTSGSDTPVASPTITAAGAILNTLVVDEFWVDVNGQQVDNIGRNFIHTIAGSIYAVADHLYRNVYTITLGSGEVIEFWGENTPQSPMP